MGVQRRTGAIAIALVIGVGLAGCAQASPGEREVRATAAAMKYKTYGRVLCTYEHNAAGPASTVGYQNSTALAGVDRVDDLTRRLTRLGYRLDVDSSKPGKPLLYGPHDVEAIITVVDPSRQGDKVHFDDSTTCRVPASGMTAISLSE